MGEAVADVTKLALLNILLDGVEELFLGDLASSQHIPSNMKNFPAGPVPGAVHTSCLALVQRGISTTIFRTVCWSLA